MENKLQTRAEQFDICLAELSPEAQEFFKLAVKEISFSLANGGGEKSAKEILLQIAKLGKVTWKQEL